MALLSSITCDCPALIEIAGKVVVTTGEFQQDRFSLEKSIVAKGGILKGHCSRYTDYLIVGARGASSIWKYGNYGTKLDRAVRLRDAGYPIIIVMEGDFLRACISRPATKACFHSQEAIPAWQRSPFAGDLVWR